MSSLTLLTIIILVFGASTLLLAGLYLLWNEFHEAGAEQVKRRIRLLSAAAVEESGAQAHANLAREEVHSPLDRALLGLPRMHHLDRFLEQTGVNLGPADSLTLTVVSGFLGAIILMAGFRSMTELPMLIGFITGATLPWLYLLRRRDKRREQLVRQLPDTLDYFARSLRAGNPFIGALKSAADEMPDPVSNELEITFDELNYGLDFEEALHNLAARVDVEEVRFFVTAVLVQKSTGGNLAEILSRIATLLRERLRTRGEVLIQAAEMRASARILIVLPFAIAGLLQLLNPAYLPILLDTPTGRTIILVQLTLMLVGYLIMKRMISFRI